MNTLTLVQTLTELASGVSTLASWEEKAKQLGYKITKDNKTGTYHAWAGTTHKGSFKAGSGKGSVQERIEPADDSIGAAHWYIVNTKDQICSQPYKSRAHAQQHFDRLQWVKSSEHSIEYGVDDDGKFVEAGLDEGVMKEYDEVGFLKQLIADLHPRGGDKEEYFRIISKQVPASYAQSSEFKTYFSKAYDEFYGIDDGEEVVEADSVQTGHGAAGVHSAQSGGYVERPRLEQLIQQALDTLYQSPTPASSDDIADRVAQYIGVDPVDPNFTAALRAVLTSEQIGENRMGFDKLTKELRAKGVSNPEALAAWIGRRKYGKSKFQKAAASGTNVSEEGASNPVKREFVIHFTDKTGKKRTAKKSAYSPRIVKRNFQDTAREYGLKLLDITQAGKSVIDEAHETATNVTSAKRRFSDFVPQLAEQTIVIGSTVKILTGPEEFVNQHGRVEIFNESTAADQSSSYVIKCDNGKRVQLAPAAIKFVK